MRRLIILLSLFILPVMACSLIGQTSSPTLEISTQTQVIAPTKMPLPTATDIPANGQALDGPNINFNGIHFTLDPSLGSRVYVFDDVITWPPEGGTAHSLRFSITPEEYCWEWCLDVYRVADFEQAIPEFVFPGEVAVVFEAQKKSLSFQNGSGDRALEVFAQDHYWVTNELLRYVFRGYSTDKQYGIFLQIHTQAANLPVATPTMTNHVQDILDYNQLMAQAMNTMSAKDFTPNLDVLDALVTSIYVGQ